MALIWLLWIDLRWKVEEDSEEAVKHGEEEEEEKKEEEEEEEGGGGCTVTRLGLVSLLDSK